jgi:hypothetical protein
VLVKSISFSIIAISHKIAIIIAYLHQEEDVITFLMKQDTRAVTPDISGLTCPLNVKHKPYKITVDLIHDFISSFIFV